jgi:two-component system chemotaxis response regulator CheY
MKILIVDDSKAMRSIVRRALRKAGYGDAECEEAENGKLGLDAVGNFSPDLVLCDWNMPEMNGIDMLRALRGGGSGVKFGFVTSEGTDEMRKTAREAGAEFLIAKPFTPEAFKDAITGALG